MRNGFALQRMVAALHTQPPRDRIRNFSMSQGNAMSSHKYGMRRTDSDGCHTKSRGGGRRYTSFMCSCAGNPIADQLAEGKPINQANGMRCSTAPPRS